LQYGAGVTEDFAQAVDEILGLLRAQGRRVTTQRRAILDALLAHDHPTVEVLSAAAPDVEGSTIYRFLDDLEDLGVIDHTHLGHGPAVYHLVADPHHHLACEACGAVIEIPAAELAALRDRVREHYGFVLSPRHFALPGRCVGCG
jgi:Fur family ferric uptake transcriptional regulator